MDLPSHDRGVLFRCIDPGGCDRELLPGWQGAGGRRRRRLMGAMIHADAPRELCAGRCQSEASMKRLMILPRKNLPCLATK